MKRDPVKLLGAIHLIVLATLAGLTAVGTPSALTSGVLFAALFASAAGLLISRFRYTARLRDVNRQLGRALAGNVNTRILANDDPALNEVIFSVNELIGQLDKLQVYTIKTETGRKRFLSNISHDIRTPLTSIIGYIDALRDGVAGSEEQKRQYLDVLARKSGALKTLIDEVFLLAKLDADEIRLQPARLDLAETVREAVIEFLPELHQAGLELVMQLPEEACPVVADRVCLLRMLNNLIQNAVKHGADGNKLGLELSCAQGEYCLTVWDNGAGIPAEELGLVFERMYRTDASRSRAGGGSGLGLAITKALAEKHGGTLGADSDPGVRTAFYLTLPVTGKGLQPADDILRNN
ncbi:sensor histidine kinase [Paenibacillus chitinolyticus]|uniref:sensor histidine kinase n=1 Tax=Paenibacillus chitinolyticus TaxID=79263 RepID=UPI0036D812EE